MDPPCSYSTLVFTETAQMYISSSSYCTCLVFALSNMMQAGPGLRIKVVIFDLTNLGHPALFISIKDVVIEVVFPGIIRHATPCALNPLLLLLIGVSCFLFWQKRPMRVNEAIKHSHHSFLVNRRRNISMKGTKKSNVHIHARGVPTFNLFTAKGNFD